MKLLAIDTASSACSVALLADGRVVADRSLVMERGHAEALMPMVEEVLDDARAACPAGFQDIDAIAVTVGPGAFTGVRIGLAAAGALAAAAGIPLLGLTTLEVVAAANAGHGRPLLVALDSKRTDVYLQIFDASGEPMTEPMAVPAGSVPGLLPDGPLSLAGDGSASVAEALRAAGRAFVQLPGSGRADAAVLARLAAERYRGAGQDTGPASLSPPKPLYLRAPDVSLPKPRQ